MTELKSASSDILYFDNSCPVCRREVGHLQAIAGPGLICVDINSESLSAEERTQYSQILHLKTSDGQWLTGLEANVQAWQHTPYARLSRLLLAPVVRPLAEAGYALWLRYYQWQRSRRIQSARTGEHGT
ncbi:MAG: DUF393 domain-containing protein [Pseudomonadales bacterium]|nr:DUF393 domain-containing protein [Pseudomonadales bacterium]